MTRLVDIAKNAGVSISTVSRVLNEDETFSISEQTRANVHRIAREMNYPVHTRRRKPRKPARYSIGFVMLYTAKDEINDPYYLLIRTHMKNEATKLKSRTREIFYDTSDSTKSDISRCSALIIIGERALWTAEVEATIIESNKPVIFVDFSVDLLGSDSVETDSALLMNTAIGHLISVGYKNIGYLGVRENHHETNIPLVSPMENYFQMVLQRHNLFNPDFIFTNSKMDFESGYKNFESGYNLCCEMLSRNKRPEAIFVANDTMAIGAIKALKEKKVSIPGEMALIGCNDIPTGGYVSPSLTTMRIDTELMGQIAVRLALDRINMARERGIKVFVPNQLIIRQSCGAIQKN